MFSKTLIGLFVLQGLTILLVQGQGFKFETSADRNNVQKAAAAPSDELSEEDCRCQCLDLTYTGPDGKEKGNCKT